MNEKQDLQKEVADALQQLRKAKRAYEVFKALKSAEALSEFLGYVKGYL